MSFREDFLAVICEYERMFVQAQVICVILLMLLVFSWVIVRPEPGTETHSIILVDFVIVGIPLVGVSVLRHFCRQQSTSTLRDLWGRNR